jgi:hypothetical protein
MTDILDLELSEDLVEFETLDRSMLAAGCFSTLATASTLSCPGSSAYTYTSASSAS